MGNGCLKSTKSTNTQNNDNFNPVAKLVSYKRKRRSTVASLNSIDEFQQKLTINLLTKRDKELIERCWRHQISTVRRDIFHRTMLLCIESSPKISEVIACAKFCYKDLTKWPKLNRICQAQFVFFEKLIYLYNLEEKSMFEPCWRLGEMHANYSQFGLKPHFLDIYQQQFLGQLARMEMEDKVETCIAFTHLIGFVVEIMNQGYTQKCSEFRNDGTSKGGMIMFI